MNNPVEKENRPQDDYKKELKNRPCASGYFQEALSDFMYDAAGGRAVRHLVEEGCTSAQIQQQLDYPVPFAKIKKTVTKHLLETGTLLHALPIPAESFTTVLFNSFREEALFSCLARHIRLDGEENSYISCPFGHMHDDAADGIPRLLAPLTTREREYILGILWEPETMYHRLNRRMLEIGVQLARHNREISFYFLKSMEVLRLP